MAPYCGATDAIQRARPVDLESARREARIKRYSPRHSILGAVVPMSTYMNSGAPLSRGGGRSGRSGPFRPLRHRSSRPSSCSQQPDARAVRHSFRERRAALAARARGEQQCKGSTRYIRAHGPGRRVGSSASTVSVSAPCRLTACTTSVAEN